MLHPCSPAPSILAHCEAHPSAANVDHQHYRLRDDLYTVLPNDRPDSEGDDSTVVSYSAYAANHTLTANVDHQHHTLRGDSDAVLPNGHRESEGDDSTAISYSACAVDHTLVVQATVPSQMLHPCSPAPSILAHCEAHPSAANVDHQHYTLRDDSDTVLPNGHPGSEGHDSTVVSDSAYAANHTLDVEAAVPSQMLHPCSPAPSILAHCEAHPSAANVDHQHHMHCSDSHAVPLNGHLDSKGDDCVGMSSSAHAADQTLVGFAFMARVKTV
ncbi:uncharacterized protein ISCGN_011054 [Ixodes scapularis]